MDYEVLRPQLIWMNKSCYRKTAFTNASSNACSGGDTIDDYAEDDIDSYCKENEYNLNEKNAIEEKYFIEKVNERYIASLQVASAFYGFIIGKGGVSKKRIEYETNTTITLPRKGVENENIVIKGDSKSGVANACSRILLIVESSRSKMDQTHFISIPLNSKDMQEAQMTFRKDVIELIHEKKSEKSHFTNNSHSVIDDSIFQTPSLLHLTIGTLSLMDNRERQQACELLEDCKESIIIPLIGATGLKVEVSGLEIMNDDPAEVDVIYAKVQPASSSNDGERNILQKIADMIVDKFVASGLMKRQFDRVKLHLTVMNTKFQASNREYIETSESNSAYDNNTLEKETRVPTRARIDARDILSKYGNRHFNTTFISEIHLSQLKTGRKGKSGVSTGDDNYYAASTIVKLTSCG